MEGLIEALNTELTCSEGPVPGRIESNTSGVPDKDAIAQIKIQYFTANLSDPAEVAELEKIMTRALQSENSLQKVGDLVVFREEATFDRDGNYLVAIKYAEFFERPKDKE